MVGRKGLQERTLLYEHLWIKLEQQLPTPLLRVGVNENTLKSVGQVEAIRMLPKGRCINKGHPFASIERGRKIVVLRSPVSGTIVEINEELQNNPQLMNEDAYRKGWIAVIKPNDVSEIERLI